MLANMQPFNEYQLNKYVLRTLSSMWSPHNGFAVPIAFFSTKVQDLAQLVNNHARSSVNTKTARDFLVSYVNNAINQERLQFVKK